MVVVPPLGARAEGCNTGKKSVLGISGSRQIGWPLATVVFGRLEVAFSVLDIDCAHQ